MPIELSQQNQATVANSYLLSLIEFCEHTVGSEVYNSLKFLNIEKLKQSPPDRRVDAQDYNKTLTTVSKKFNLPTLGLDFGAQIGAAAFNLLGYLTMASDTLGSAAVGLQKYNRLVSNMGQSEISFDDETGYAEWLVGGEASNFSYHVVDAVLAGWCSFSRRIVEKQIPVIKVELKHQNLGQKQHYEKVFGGEVVFNAHKNRIIFERKWFDLPVAQAQQTVYQAVVSQAEYAIAKIDETNQVSEQQIVNVIQQCLPTGNFNIDSIAKKFKVSERTFQRKLNQHGLTFRDLLETARNQLAVELLMQDELPLSTISGLVGFTEQSAFTRAFKRWQGCTPKQFQKSK